MCFRKALVKGFSKTYDMLPPFVATEKTMAATKKDD
jgi:hypothetical protein